MISTQQIIRIHQIWSEMFTLFQHLHPSNRLSASHYLHSVWGLLTTFTDSYTPWDAPDAFAQRFKGYVEKEDAILKDNLESLHYATDGLDTLSLVSGPGRPEKVMLKFDSTFIRSLTI